MNNNNTNTMEQAEDDNDETQLDNEEEEKVEEERLVPETPIPWKPLCIVLLMFIADSFSFNTLAPYITNMVTFLGMVPDGDRRKIGTWAGIIASSYFFTQFFSAIIWGAISDRYGRRPVLLIGIAGSAVTTLMFGFSTSIYMAVGSRALLGLLNGNLGVFKVYLAEISDKTNQAKIFSFLSGSFSIGSIIGPLIGAGLADPITQFPSLKNYLPAFLTNFLVRFPYLPPNLVLCVMNVCAIVLGFFYLKETNPTILGLQQQNIPEEQETDIQLEESIVGNDEYPEFNSEENSSSDLSELTKQESPEIVSMSWKDYILQKLKPENEIYTTLPPLIVASTYATLGATGTVFGELMPLFLVLKPEDGGLNFTQSKIGILNAVSAVLILVWVFYFNPKVIKKLGCLKAFRIAALLIIPCVLVFPPMNYLYSIPWLMWTSLFIVYIVRQALYQILASATAIMTNNSISSANMGKLNGISQSAVAFTRSIAPSTAGFLFSWSLRVDRFPFNIYFVFMLLAAIYIILQLLMIPLPQSINAPKLIPEQMNTEDSPEQKV